MSHFNRKDRERVSRQQAAERLTDLACALAAGPPLALTLDGQRVTIPLPDELFLTGEMRSADDGLELALTWSTAKPLSYDESDSTSPSVGRRRPGAAPR